jgi:hypothetical protein
MKRFFLLMLVACLYVVTNAQNLVPISWTAYGLTFDAPKGILIEEDTEDTFLLNNSRFYITIHSLDSDDMKKEELTELLKGLADDDGVQIKSEVMSWDLEQFHTYYLKGVAEGDPCYYMCLMTKEAGSLFYVSIIYNRTEDKVVEKMLKSFKMEEE